MELSLTTVTYSDTHSLTEESDSTTCSVVGCTVVFFLFQCRAAFSAAAIGIDALLGGFRAGSGVHDSYRFQCGLVGSFTSPGIETR